MNKKTVTGIVVVGAISVLLLSAILIQAPKREQPSAPATLVSLNRDADKATEALKTRDFAKLEELLGTHEKTEQTITHILKFLETSESASVQKDIFPLLVKELEKKDQRVREQVLIFRAFSFMNLDIRQQKILRKVFSAQKLRKDFLPQVFISSVPFPPDQEAFLLNQLGSKVPSNGTEALYLAGLVKDPAAKKRLTRQFLKKFSATSPVLKPYLAKFVIVQSDAELRREKSYASFISFVRKQKGDLWNEVNRAME